ncbi:hypothetical protein WNZ14_09125 [Hoeflea sp. AS60]|uniref:hypothetical protein n=1 Tax=Hoeflea sp. AS60 TaxID=3135780 RepID=UPI003174C98F
MQQLVETDQAPEECIIRPRRKPPDLVLAPIEMIMDKEFTQYNRKEQNRLDSESDQDHCCSSGMEAGMQQAAGVAVSTLVPEVIGFLKLEIEQKVLDLEKPQKCKKRWNHGALSFLPES